MVPNVDETVGHKYKIRKNNVVLQYVLLSRSVTIKIYVLK